MLRSETSRTSTIKSFLQLHDTIRTTAHRISSEIRLPRVGIEEDCTLSTSRALSRDIEFGILRQQAGTSCTSGLRISGSVSLSFGRGASCEHFYMLHFSKFRLVVSHFR